MSKKISIVLILALVVVLTATLVACNDAKVQTPDVIGPSGSGGGSTVAESGAYLRFSYTTHVNSVFSAVYLDEFDVSDIKYYVVYVDKKGSPTREVDMGSVREEMIAEEDRPLLKVKGHHNIRISDVLDDGKVASGTFTLHLKDRSVTERVTLTFNIGAANAYFGSGSEQSGGQTVIKVQVDKGASFSSWSEFLRTFRLTLQDKALVGYTYQEGGSAKEIGEAGGFDVPFVINKNYTFTPHWDDNVIHVHFHLNLPAVANVADGSADPRQTFDAKYGSVAVRRNTGTIGRPADSEFNVFANLYFAGWYTAKTSDGGVQLDSLWNFSQTVRATDIDLYAKWVEHSYSYTLYTMGGSFAEGLQPSKVDKGTSQETVTEANYKELGLILVDSSSRFSSATGVLNRIVFSGLSYDVKYDSYVAKVQTKADGTTVMLKLSDVLGAGSSVFTKGDGNYLKSTGIYGDYQCTQDLHFAGASQVKNDVCAYIGWSFDGGENYDENLSDYYQKVLVKDGFTIKADGSVRLDDVDDDTVNAVVIPEYLIVNGTARAVTEIGESAFMNLKGLTSVDFSRATHLAKIGEEAFAYCPYLSTLTFPSDENCVITQVGQDAFEHTAYEERYYATSFGVEFIIIKNILYKYVGSPEKIEIDLTKDPYYDREAFPEDSVPDELLERLNNSVKGIVNIAEGAFEDATMLESVAFPAKLETIEEGAFRNLKGLRSVDVPGIDKGDEVDPNLDGLETGNALKYVHENAFEGCDLFLSNNRTNDNYRPFMDAVLIGNIYYRHVQDEVSTATIPKQYRCGHNNWFEIKYIAPLAFKGCTHIEDVVIEAPENIELIGGDAFSNTTYIHNTGESFIVVNGILAEFVGPQEKNVIVPSEVTAISDRAFNSYATNVQTVEIRQNVKSIGSYAFYGARQLESVILSSATVGGDVLEAPAIADDSFADKDGQMIDGLKIYVTQEVYDFLKGLADKIETADAITDPVTRRWAALFHYNEENFEVEKINELSLNSRFSRRLLSSGKIEDPATAIHKAFFDLYGTNEALLDSAIIVRSNTGAEMSRDRIEQGSLKFTLSSNLLEGDEGYATFTAKYTYHGDDYDLGQFTLYAAAVGNTLSRFYASNVYTDKVNGGQRINLLGFRKLAADKADPQSDFWFEGLDGSIPSKDSIVYYTSTDRASVVPVFCYKDANGKIHRMKTGITMRQFSTSSEHEFMEAELTVNFNGLGTYRFYFPFTARKAKFTTIEQVGAISLPLNSNGEALIAQYTVTLLSEDKLKKTFELSAYNFIFNSDVKTDALGYHTLNISYIRPDECADNISVSADIHYTIALSAASDIFGFQIKGRPFNEGDKHYDGTATLVSYVGANPASALSLIVPDEYQTQDRVYKVTEIGDGATSPFARCVNLQTIYLSQNITRVAVNAFSGLKALKTVHTASPNSTKDVALKEANYTVVTEGKTESEISIKSFDGLEFAMEEGEDIAILSLPATFDADGKTYRVVGFDGQVRLPSSSAESKYVYLPDTIYKDVDLLDSEGNPLGASYHVVFYKNAAKYRVEEKLPAALKYIGNNAFAECASLVDFDLTDATALEDIGVRAFANSGLTSIDLSQNKLITEISDQCFEGSGSLTNVVLPSDVEYIGTSAFGNCVALEQVDGLGEALTTIKMNAFSSCRSLLVFDLYATVVSVEDGAFGSCGALTLRCHVKQDTKPAGWVALNTMSNPIIWDAGTSDVASDGKIYYVEPTSGIRYALSYGGDKYTATVVSQKFTLKTAAISDKVHYKDHDYTVVAIAEDAFRNNVNLRSVTVDMHLTTIERNAFFGCVSLNSFGFVGDNGLTSISDEAFEGCDASFARPTVPTEVKKDGFVYSLDRSNGQATIVNFENLTDAIVINDTFTYADIEYKIVAIGAGAFRNNVNIKSVTIGNNVVTIGAEAFAGCSQLATVTLGNGVTTIESKAFADTAALATFDVQSAVLTSVAEDAFEGSALPEESKPKAA